MKTIHLARTIAALALGWYMLGPSVSAAQSSDESEPSASIQPLEPRELAPISIVMPMQNLPARGIRGLVTRQVSVCCYDEQVYLWEWDRIGDTAPDPFKNEMASAEAMHEN